MPTLEITVRWLGEPPTAGYHGSEWPPSPARLFRALLAGAQRPGGSGERGREALQRLSACPAPTIEAAEACRAVSVKTAVPNNDGDRIAEAYRKGQGKLARLRWASLHTMRQREPWLVPSAVRYRWAFDEADPDPDAFDRLADDLTVLGQGSDLAVARAEWHDNAQAPAMATWRPSADGPVLMPVPDRDELERLASTYQRERSRIQADGVRGRREPPSAMAAYRDLMGPRLIGGKPFGSARSMAVNPGQKRGVSRCAWRPWCATPFSKRLPRQGWMTRPSPSSWGTQSRPPLYAAPAEHRAPPCRRAGPPGYACGPTERLRLRVGDQPARPPD